MDAVSDHPTNEIQFESM